MSARWPLGPALLVLLAGCESWVTKELHEKAYAYACDRGAADAGCSRGWRCGVEGRCFDPTEVLPRRCERALERATDGGLDCTGGWRCGLDGLCFDPAPDAGLARACSHLQERDAGAYDCAEGWRCGLDDRCFPLVVADDAGVVSALSRACDRAAEEQGESLDCPLGWRCGVDERCFNARVAAQRSCDRPLELRHDGGFDCTLGWRCGMDNRCFDPLLPAPRSCDRLVELDGGAYDCTGGWHCSPSNACFDPGQEVSRTCERPLEREYEAATDAGYDCAPGWRCGLDRRCFDARVAGARPCDRAEELDAGKTYDCTGGWRCGLDARCFDPGAGAPHACTRAFELARDGGWDCAPGWRCGQENECYELAVAQARACDVSLGNADCRAGWRCAARGTCQDEYVGAPYPCTGDVDCERGDLGWRCDRVAHTCAQVTDRLTTGRLAPGTELRSPLLDWPRPTLAAISDELALGLNNGTGDVTLQGPGSSSGRATPGRVMAQVVDGGLHLGIHANDLKGNGATRTSFLHAACGGGTPTSLATLGPWALAAYADGGVQAWGLRVAQGTGQAASCVPVSLPPGPAGAVVRVTTSIADGGSAAVLFTANQAMTVAPAGAGPGWDTQDPTILDAVELSPVTTPGQPPPPGSIPVVRLTAHTVAIMVAEPAATPSGPSAVPGTALQAGVFQLDGLVPGGVPARLLVGPAAASATGGPRESLAVIWNSTLTGKPMAVTFLYRSNVAASAQLEYRGTVSLCPGGAEALSVTAGPGDSATTRQSVLVRCDNVQNAALNLSIPARTWQVSTNNSPVLMEAPRLAGFDEDPAPFRRPMTAPLNHPTVRAFFGGHGQAWSYSSEEIAALDPTLVPHRVLLDREPDLLFRYLVPGDGGLADSTIMSYQGRYQFDVGDLGLVSRFAAEQGLEFLATSRQLPFLALTPSMVIGSGQGVGTDGPQVVALGTTAFQRPATVSAVTTPSGDQDLFVTSYDAIYRARVTTQLGNPNVAPATLGHGFTPVAGNPIQSFAVGTTSPSDGGAPELRGYAVVRGQVYTFVLDGTAWTADRVPTDIGAGVPLDVMRVDVDGGSIFRLGYDTGVVASIPAVAPLSNPLDAGARVSQYALVCGDTYALGATGVWRAQARPGALATWTPVPMPPGLANPSRLYGGASTLFVATSLGEIAEIAYDGGAGTLPVCP